MSDISEMRRVLTEASSAAVLSPQDQDVLLAGHRETLMAESDAQLTTYRELLQGVGVRPDGGIAEHVGVSVLRALKAGRKRLPIWPGRDAWGGVPGLCTTLTPPSFTIESPLERTSDDGQLTTFSRASAAARTLEVAAATGEFGGQDWPSSGSFILGFNRAEAAIGGVLSVPPHGAGAVLEVAVHLQIEQVLFDGTTVPGVAASLLYALRGNGDLPLRGAAATWCRAGISLHGADGSARTSTDFVSEWSNRDGMDSDDHAPGGGLTLRQTVALRPDTSELTVFVDATCFAAVEESPTPFLTGFASFECREKPVTEIVGIYVPPSRLRMDRVDVRLCELPVLAL